MTISRAKWRLLSWYALSTIVAEYRRRLFCINWSRSRVEQSTVEELWVHSCKWLTVFLQISCWWWPKMCMRTERALCMHRWWGCSECHWYYATMGCRMGSNGWITVSHIIHIVWRRGLLSGNHAITVGIMFRSGQLDIAGKMFKVHQATRTLLWEHGCNENPVFS